MSVDGRTGSTCTVGKRPVLQLIRARSSVSILRPGCSANVGARRELSIVAPGTSGQVRADCKAGTSQLG